MPALTRLRPDAFTLLLVGAVATASLLPCQGEWAVTFGWATKAAIALLFFLHGAKLSRKAILAGVGNWRLHLTVLAITFGLFPLVGLAAAGLAPWLISPAVAQGVLFLTLLPATVQSSIAFTSIAGGNVPAAVCSASASNLLGILVTPILVGLTLGATAHAAGERRGGALTPVGAIMLQLLVPFVLGHLSRPLTAGFVERNRGWLGRVDRGSILLVVYTAFSAAVVEGLWRRLSAADLVAVVLLDCAILAAALAATTIGARRLGFSRSDEIAIVFCGSKKSLASGVPMAGVLFPAASIGAMLVPLMIFHQIQLMVCAVLARRYAERASVSLAAEEISV